MKQEDIDKLTNSILTKHGQGFAGQDMDLTSMAQRMALGGSRGANAFDSELFRMGNLKEMMPPASASDLAAAAASPGKPGAAAGNSDVAEQEDFALGKDLISCS